MFVLKDDLVK